MDLFDKTLQDIKLSINVDGLPISKSSAKTFSPILAKSGSHRVSMIALWYGDRKPDNSNQFLEPFIEELKTLSESGRTINNLKLQRTIEKFDL